MFDTTEQEVKEMAQAKNDRDNTTKKRQELFLREYARVGIVSHAAVVAGIHRSTYYDWYNSGEEFRELAIDAKKAAIDAMEYEAWRRATQGTTKPVYYQGREVGGIQEYSDNLLMFLLKANDPDKFKDRVQNEVTGDGLTVVIGASKERVD